MLKSFRMDADKATREMRASRLWGEVAPRPPWTSFHGSRAASSILLRFDLRQIRMCAPPRKEKKRRLILRQYWNQYSSASASHSIRLLVSAGLRQPSAPV